jgi:hypothetical protein
MGFNSAFKGLMLYRKMIVVCSEIRTKYINTMWVQNVVFQNVEARSKYSNHWAFKG